MWAESRTGRNKLAAINHILSSLAGLCRLFIFNPAFKRRAILITNSKIRRVSTAKPQQLPRFFSLVRANFVRRAESAEPDEQFRVYLDPDVDHHRPRRDEPPGWHRTRFLPAPTESDGRSPRCFHCRNFARPRFKLVGRI